MIPIRYGSRSLMVRRVSTVTTVLVVSLVVMIIFIVSGIAEGLKESVLRGVSGENHWIVLSRGNTAEPSSFITREEYEIIRSRPEIAQDKDGQPLVSPELVTGFNPDPEYIGQDATYFRGVFRIAFTVHSGLKIDAGRLPNPGSAEMLVGHKLAGRFKDLTPGKQVKFGRHMWDIVGVFSDDGSSRESEVLGDAEALAQDVHFADGFNSLAIVLNSGTGSEFRRSLTTDARLRLDALSEREFYSHQTEIADRLRGMGLVVAFILSVGSFFAAMNTMYSEVSRRFSEIGILRALGFGRGALLCSFLLESLFIGAAAGVIGELLGIAIVEAFGLGSRELTVGRYMFTFQLTLSVLAQGLFAGASICAIGGLLPAWQASRGTVVDRLRVM
jgi:putative ABC transport system permease protein